MLYCQNEVPGMKISESLGNGGPTLSFEFFPPKTPAASEALFQIIHNGLMPLNPTFVSVTYGAGGSTRELTHDLVVRIQRETGLTVVAHLTCVGSTRCEIAEILDRYHASGIRNIMALRGDPPQDELSFRPPADGFAHASDLVAFIRNRFPDMGIGVAGFTEGHPESLNRLREMDHFKRKVEAGADYVCTQLFFDNHDFFDFCERCELAGIRIPVLAGLMPVTSMRTLKRMADLAPRARFPGPLLKAVVDAKSEAGVEQAGIEWTARQVRELLAGGVHGLHFYTLNKSAQIRRVWEAAGLSLTSFKRN